MKKIPYITAFCLVFIILALTLTLTTSKVSRNTRTNTVLVKTCGIYTIVGWPAGILILGDLDSSVSTLSSIDKYFIRDGLGLGGSIPRGYEIHRDKEGRMFAYLFKAGAVKLYPSDVNIFLARLMVEKVAGQ